MVYFGEGGESIYGAVGWGEVSVCVGKRTGVPLCMKYVILQRELVTTADCGDCDSNQRRRESTQSEAAATATSRKAQKQQHTKQQTGMNRASLSVCVCVDNEAKLKISKL